MRIRIGVDEWIAVASYTTKNSRGQTEPLELVADNLDQCVAVAIGWGRLVSLALVSAFCRADTWADAPGGSGYLHRLNRALRDCEVAARRPPIDAAIVSATGSNPWLETHLYDWLDHRGVDVVTRSALSTAAKIRPLKGGLRLGTWDYDPRQPTDRYATSRDANAAIQVYQPLSAHAAPALGFDELG